MPLHAPGLPKKNGKAGSAKPGAAQRNARMGTGDAPSILIESAEGIATFPGLNGDQESQVARAFINRRLAEIPEQREARKDPRPTAGPANPK